MTTIVSSLVCRSHVDMAFDCLGTMLKHCTSDLKVQIHEDGTITDEDVAKLRGLGPIEIVRRNDADERMRDELRDFPRLMELRKEFPLALKLLDTVTFHPGPDYAFVDSDVMFIRPFVNPFQFDEQSLHKAVFMDDRENCYSFRSWGLWREGISLPARVNSGMVLFEKNFYDLARLDWFLSRPASSAIAGMREQTAWAFLGKEVGCRKFSPKHARIMREDEPDGELIAGHFTARARALLPEYLRRSEASLRDEPAVLQTDDGGRCTAWDVGRFELSRLASKFSMKKN